jgi:hypothetical protein
MKKSIFIALIAVLFFPTFSFGQTVNNYSKLTGSWQGVVTAEGDSQIVVLDIVGDSTLKIIVSMPWAAILNISANKTSLQGDSLVFRVSQPQFSFRGAVNYEKMQIIGLYKQGKSYPLTLQKTTNPARMNRPQTPKEPYTYRSEDVEFTNTKQNIKFAGTLTLPEGNGPFPAVVLITGSGPQNRNEELLGHQPFWVIADYLTRNGIAVLRYDDRGVGKSAGKYSEGTTLDFANDAEAAFDFLLKDKRINSNKIGIMGHSEGGIIAPIVASRNKKVKFVVMLAGTGVDGKAVMLEQYRLILKASSIPDSIIEPLVDLNRQAFDIVLTTPDNTKAGEKIREVTNNIIVQMGEETAKKYNLTKLSAEKLILQILNPWMKEFMRLNPADYLSKVNCPILALNGDLDLQVPPDQNLPAIKKAVDKNKNGKLTEIKLPGLNHLFQTAKTGSPSEYARIEETFSEAALKEILKFITGL